jgi:hypothetical protein
MMTPSQVMIKMKRVENQLTSTAMILTHLTRAGRLALNVIYWIVLSVEVFIMNNRLTNPQASNETDVISPFTSLVQVSSTAMVMRQFTIHEFSNEH